MKIYISKLEYGGNGQPDYEEYYVFNERGEGYKILIISDDELTYEAIDIQKVNFRDVAVHDLIEVKDVDPEFMNRLERMLKLWESLSNEVSDVISKLNTLIEIKSK